jgi:MFS family permease
MLPAEALHRLRILRNRDVRRLLAALAASGVSGWAYGVALSVFAFHSGGTTAVAVVGFLVMVPAGVAAPFAAAVVDRFRRDRVLVVSSVVRAAVLGTAAATMLLDGPAGLVYALAVVASLASRVFYPAEAALLPSFAREPGDLVAANSLATAVENGCFLVGPAVGGALLAVTSPGVTVAVCGGIVLIAAVQASRLSHVELPFEPRSAPSLDLLGGLTAVTRDLSMRLVVGLYGLVTLGMGALGVLVVALALSVLGLGQGGVGYLNAALGAGALVGSVAAIVLVRVRLGPALAVSVGLWGVGLAVIGAWPRTAIVAPLLVLIGGAGTIVDVACVTLLQRAAPDEIRGRVFGVLEGVLVASIGIGALLAPLLQHALGLRGAVAAMGGFVGAVGSVLALRAADAADDEQRRRLHLLRRYPTAARLSLPVLEGVAAALVHLKASAGDVIVRAGDAATRFYLLASGQAEAVSVTGSATALGSGDWFGEKALLRDTANEVTVSATSDVELYALAGDTFLRSLSGFAGAPAAQVRPAG